MCPDVSVGGKDQVTGIGGTENEMKNSQETETVTAETLKLSDSA